MYCWKCGAHNPNTSLFCFKCGNNLSSGESPRKQPGEDKPIPPAPKIPVAPPPVSSKPAAPIPPAPKPVTPFQPSPPQKSSQQEQETQQILPEVPPKPIPQQPIPSKPTPQQTDYSQIATEVTHSPTGIIGNRYKIGKELGRGGRGIVFKAFDTQLEVYIAIKFLPQELSVDKTAVEEMKTEAKAAMMLSHPNIVRLHNFEDMSGYKFLTMEFINGPTLDEMLIRRKQFTVNETVKYSLQILDGLDYAHKKGIIHKDLKPSNLMKTPEGAIRLTDYGIASILSDSIQKISTEYVIGTPRYMSPEQLLGKYLDNRTDLYSFGVVMYELLNGEPPFKGGGLEYQIINTPPAPLLNIPEKLNYIIMKALSKKREDRWETARQFSDALEGKLKIILPHEVGKKEPLGTRIKASVSEITSGFKTSIRDAHKQMRRAKLERRKEVFEKKKKLPGFKESTIFRHTLIGIWSLLFAFVFPFNIDVSGGREMFLLLSFFIHAMIFGTIAYSKLFSGIASGLLPIFAYLVSFASSNTYVSTKGILGVLVIALINGFIGWLITEFRVYRGFDLISLWENRDLFLLWFVIVGGLFLIPVLDDHTQLGLTHFSVFGFVLLIALCIKHGYNSFIFPVITLALYSFSRLGLDNLIASITSGDGEIMLGREILPLSSFKTLIWEIALLTGLLSLILVLMSFVFHFFANNIRYVGKIIASIVLIGLTVYAYQFWVVNDIYVGSKVFIPSGEARMGITEAGATNLSTLYGWNFDDFAPEFPGNVSIVQEFYIDKHEVTNRQYKEFIEATGYDAPKPWLGGDYLFLKDFEPITGITYEDAREYAKWKKGRIPTEQEWILAARGPGKSRFPWGNETELGLIPRLILKSFANNQQTNLIGPSSVGWFFTDISPYGCFDMGGNVMEWVVEDYTPYKGNKKIFLVPDFKKKYHLVKGGSYNQPIFYSRASARFGVPKGSSKLDIGFRCVYDTDNEHKNEKSGKNGKKKVQKI